MNINKGSVCSECNKIFLTLGIYFSNILYPKYVLAQIIITLNK